MFLVLWGTPAGMNSSSVVGQGWCGGSVGGRARRAPRPAAPPCLPGHAWNRAAASPRLLPQRTCTAAPRPRTSGLQHKRVVEQREAHAPLHHLDRVAGGGAGRAAGHVRTAGGSLPGLRRTPPRLPSAAGKPARAAGTTRVGRHRRWLAYRDQLIGIVRKILPFVARRVDHAPAEGGEWHGVPAVDCHGSNSVGGNDLAPAAHRAAHRAHPQ